MEVMAPGVANPFGYLVLLVVITLGRSRKPIFKVEGVWKKPPSLGMCTKSNPALSECLPMAKEMSSLNCHLRWKLCCGTLPLVPKEIPLGKDTLGTLLLASIRLFQYWWPTVKLLTTRGVRMLFRVAFARINWLVVKLPSVRSLVETA